MNVSKLLAVGPRLGLQRTSTATNPPTLLKDRKPLMLVRLVLYCTTHISACYSPLAKAAATLGGSCSHLDVDVLANRFEGGKAIHVGQRIVLHVAKQDKWVSGYGLDSLEGRAHHDGYVALNALEIEKPIQVLGVGVILRYHNKVVKTDSVVVTCTRRKEGTSMIMLPAIRLKLMHLAICAHSGIMVVGTRAEHKARNGERRLARL